MSSSVEPVAGQPPRIYASWLSLSEEAAFAPAYMIGIAGCDRGCIFCHARGDWISGAGELLSSQVVASHFEGARQQGAKSIQFTGGEPTLALARLVSCLPAAAGLPLVLNSSLSTPLHLRPELLTPFSRVIVSLKFGRDLCARRLGCGDDYLATIRPRLVALHQAGIAVRIRHLVMPGHLHCCLEPTLGWLAAHLPEVPFTLLLGFVPPAHAEAPELRCALTPAARDRALALTALSGLCWEAAGEQLPAANSPLAGGESFEVVIDATGSVCLPAVGPAAQALAAGLVAQTGPRLQ
jgi:putative pyruvate formate lyase activating enzyme